MQEQVFAVLRVEGMPKKWRLTVESAMVENIATEPLDALPGVDELNAAWCTTWRRNALRPRAVDCREVLNGTAEEFEKLRDTLVQLSTDEGFYADVEIFMPTGHEALRRTPGHQYGPGNTFKSVLCARDVISVAEGVKE
ncbi:hypothetical protein CBE74_08645 [Corynebacterium silvaticum]|uniref:Uncharacterized protein n=1 Tax=Corynebacterium silvaticum TaxID=2320431 RepID=A0A7U5HMJ7_9CORY|nr:hypothetical protein [Corynebacterium silvaticum]ARU46534.2 hypothetical protein CBE74_08645 [Corynebacterium silvaticum]